MKLLKCPHCHANISFLTFVTAPSPWHLRCESCSTGLMLASQRGAILATGCVAAAVLAINAVFLANALDGQRLYIPIGLFALGLAALEATLYLHVRVSGLTLTMKHTARVDPS